MKNLLFILGILLNVTLFGQENPQEKSTRLIPSRLIINDEEFVVFDLDQEEILIKKMYYKEMYKESYLAWMQLWELEYQKSQDYLKIIKEKNERILYQDAIMQKKDEVIQSGERIKNDYKKLYNRELKKNTNLKRTVIISFVAGAAVGLIINND